MNKKEKFNYESIKKRPWSSSVPGSPIAKDGVFAPVLKNFLKATMDGRTRRVPV